MTNACPVEQLAQKAASLIPLVEADEAAYEALEAIEDEAAHCLAQSGSGASFQLRLILQAADTLLANVPSPSPSADQCDRLFDDIKAMIKSVDRVLVRLPGPEFEPTLRDWYIH